ncbi:MAG: hypothetical protein Ct9H300mP20_17760 [Gammaproteobacteria bacterium]|nr:MAG: hypothetical protein Ct9H300mP20_17760 [Gammaproteobacteria bacterium]
MKVGVPLSATMLPICWLILTKVIYPVNFETSPETRSLLTELKNELGKFSGAEVRVFIVFVLTALAWLSRSALDNLPGFKLSV